MSSFERRDFLVSSLLALFASRTYPGTLRQNRDSADLERIEVGYSNENNVASFWVPRSYHPQVHEHFFRLTLEYPSLNPAYSGPHDSTWDSVLDIQVHGFPKNGTIANYVQSARGRITSGPSEDGYRIFYEHVNNITTIKNYIYKDASGNSVAFRKLPLGQRDQLVHGFEGQFYFDCFFSKKVSNKFRDIDARISTLLMEFGRTSK